MKIEKKKNKNKYKQITIILSEFNKLDADSQKSKIEETLNTMYDGNVKVENAYIMKCIKLSISKFDDELHLPKGLLVQKDDEKMLFSFKEHRNTMLLIFLFTIMLMIGIFSATYSAIVMVRQKQVNVDLDGDGIPDLNIDTDNDGNPNINIDLTGDRKPNLNIDYRHNHMSIFNIDTNGDGKPDSNMVNDATDGKTCSLNCDKDGNGWPDYNIDLDGDGKADLYIDINNDGNADLNFDTDNDGTCDLMCDTDGDSKCDKYCSAALNGTDNSVKDGNGSIVVEGNENTDLSTAGLMVFYQDYGELSVSGLFPDDQPGMDVVFPQKKFTIKNESNYTVRYNLNWVVYKNEFESDNFKYKLEASNGGYSQDYMTAPKGNGSLTTNVTIAPLTTQSYTITFKLQGTGTDQNYDQNKVFSGYIKVGN